MQAPIKVCPNCGQSTTLDIPICSACGHRYRTQFDTAGSQAQVYTPSPRSSFGATSETPAGLTTGTPLCIQCRSQVAADSPVCRVCGTDQRAPAAPPRSHAYPPPSYSPQSYPQTPYPPPPYAPPQYPAGPTDDVRARPVIARPRPLLSRCIRPRCPMWYPPDDFEMFDLARQYRDSKRMFMWMLILGLLFFLPLLFIAYSEHKKMNLIKSRVALRGIDPERWAGPL